MRSNVKCISILQRASLLACVFLFIFKALQSMGISCKSAITTLFCVFLCLPFRPSRRRRCVLQQKIMNVCVVQLKDVRSALVYIRHFYKRIDIEMYRKHGLTTNKFLIGCVFVLSCAAEGQPSGDRITTNKIFIPEPL